MFSEKTLQEFLATTASAEPVPGGGSVAALSGALAAALAEMVANLTLGKEKYQEVETQMQADRAALTDSRERLLKLIDTDAQAFDRVMQAFKLPKDSDAAKSTRAAAIQEGLKEAALVPMSIAEEALTLMERAERMVRSGNANAVTDALVAAMMARTAVLSAALNVRINLGSIKDEDFVRRAAAQVEKLEQQARSREENLLSTTTL